VQGECDELSGLCPPGSDSADCGGSSSSSCSHLCHGKAHATLDSCDQGHSSITCNYHCNTGYYNFGTVWGGHCSACSGGEHMVETADSCSCEAGYYPNFKDDTGISCSTEDVKTCCLSCSHFPHSHEAGTGQGRTCLCDAGYHQTESACVACSSITHAMLDKDGATCVCEAGYFWNAHQSGCELQQTCAAQQTSCPLADESTGMLH
jgi:hypothetical protein